MESEIEAKKVRNFEPPELGGLRPALTSGAWTWVGGSNTFDATGVYGTQGVAAATNVVGARATPFRWKDASGNVWLFGGYQYDDPTNTRFEMNDLWMYPAAQ